MSIDDNSATFNQRSSFINRICLLLTAQCGYLWWLVMIGGCEYSQVLIFLKGMWEGYEIQPAHRPFINTRRDSQAVMQDISHPGMIHFVSLSSHSPVWNLLPLLLFFFYEMEGGADLIFKGMLFWVSGGQTSQMPVQQEWEGFICPHAPLMILIILKHLQAKQMVKHHSRTPVVLMW